MIAGPGVITGGGLWLAFWLAVGAVSMLTAGLRSTATLLLFGAAGSSEVLLGGNGGERDGDNGGAADGVDGAACGSAGVTQRRSSSRRERWTSMELVCRECVRPYCCRVCVRRLPRRDIDSLHGIHLAISTLVATLLLSTLVGRPLTVAQSAVHFCAEEASSAEARAIANGQPLVLCASRAIADRTMQMQTCEYELSGWRWTLGLMRSDVRMARVSRAEWSHGTMRWLNAGSTAARHGCLHGDPGCRPRATSTQLLFGDGGWRPAVHLTIPLCHTVPTGRLRR